MLTADGNPDPAAASLVDARQHDAELAVREGGAGLGGIVRAVDLHRARKPPERPLGQVKAGVVMLARRRLFLACNEERARFDRDLDGGRGNAGQIDEDFETRCCFDNVERRAAFGRRVATFPHPVFDKHASHP